MIEASRAFTEPNEIHLLAYRFSKVWWANLSSFEVYFWFTMDMLCAVKIQSQVAEKKLNL